MIDSGHEGPPLPARKDLMPVAARAYNAVREAEIEKATRLFDIPRETWDPYTWEKQSRAVRLLWVQDVMAVWLGGRSTHPDPWIRGIITLSVRSE